MAIGLEDLDDLAGREVVSRASKLQSGASVPVFEGEPVRIDEHDLDERRRGTTQNQERAIRQCEE